MNDEKMNDATFEKEYREFLEENCLNFYGDLRKEDNEVTCLFNPKDKLSFLDYLTEKYKEEEIKKYYSVDLGFSKIAEKIIEEIEEDSVIYHKYMRKYNVLWKEKYTEMQENIKKESEEMEILQDAFYRTAEDLENN